MKGLNKVQFVEEFQFEHREVPFHAVQDTRRVNFSVELLDYRPLATDRLVDYLACGERFPDRTIAEHTIEAND